MWQNIGSAVGNAIQKVKKIQMELESQLDAAVGADSVKIVDYSSIDVKDVLLDTHSCETQHADEVAVSIEKSELEHNSIRVSSPNNSVLNFEEPEKPIIIVDDAYTSIKDSENIEISKAKEQVVVLEVPSITVIANTNESSILTNPKNTNRTKKNRTKVNHVDSNSPIQDPKTINRPATKASVEIETPLDTKLVVEDERMNGNDLKTLSIHSDEEIKYSVQLEHDNNINHEKEKLNMNQDHEHDNIITNQSIPNNLNNIMYEKEIAKFKEVIAERERALETAMTKMYEVNQLYEESQSLITVLKNELSDKTNRIEQLQKINLESDTKAKIKQLQDILSEKDERLAAFEHEGQILSKKQNDLEKQIKQSKKDLKDKSSEIAKLKDSKEQLVKAIEEMQEVIRKHEADLNNASKSQSAMNAVNQASHEKMMKLEADITSKIEEISSQRRALETAWTECNDLKRQNVEIKAERDELKRQLTEGNSKFFETESSRRDVEQREAILKATSKQLQDSLQRQMTEFSIREERLREEVNEMRKRWQEAISSRENLATELASSTAPLLRQISALQDSLRVKSESWQSIESSLLERSFRAEKAAELAESVKRNLEDQFESLKAEHNDILSKLQKCHNFIQDAENTNNQLQKLNSTLTDQVRELQSQLYFEIGQKQNLQTSLHELEIRKNLEMQQIRDKFEDSLSKADLKISLLQSEKDSFYEQFKEEIHKTWKRDDLIIGSLQNSNSKPTHDTSQIQTSPTSGNFADKARLMQSRVRKDDETRTILMRISQIEASRDALLEEVSYLSSINAQLEEKLSATTKDREASLKIKKQNETLLVLLGEKEEELQAAINDNKEIRDLYKAHIRELIDKIAPP